MNTRLESHSKYRFTIKVVTMSRAYDTNERGDGSGNYGNKDRY